MSRIIDADKLSADMYHEAFEKDSDMQKWDSGCWIRYKMFENVLKAQPTVEAPDINVGNIDTTTHGSNAVKKGGNDEDRTSGDCISKTGYWILDRSGAYCCNKCMEPCASYVMMKPRDKFCKMCGSRNEVME